MVHDDEYSLSMTCDWGYLYCQDLSKNINFMVIQTCVLSNEQTILK